MLVAEPFDRDDVASFDLRERHEARAHRLAVDEHRARAALAFAAAFLRAGEAALLAQHVEQPRHRMRVERPAVDAPFSVKRMRPREQFGRGGNLAHVEAAGDEAR